MEIKVLIKNVMSLPCCEDTKIDHEHILFNIYSSDFHGNWLVPDYKGETWQNRLLREIRMQNSFASKFAPKCTKECAFPPCRGCPRAPEGPLASGKVGDTAPGRAGKRPWAASAEAASELGSEHLRFISTPSESLRQPPRV